MTRIALSLLVLFLIATLPAPGASAQKKTDRPLRMAVLGAPASVARLCTHLYGGGFESKAPLFETLVKRSPEGRLLPGLAAGWELRDEGRSVILTLRKGIMFHDGRPMDAEIVRWNFRCWSGQPLHAWLRATRRIRKVTALGPDRVRIDLDRPYALLPDLCAMNPTGILGPGSLDRRGAYEKPVGTGPFRFVKAEDGCRVLHYARFRPGEEESDGRGLLDLVRFPEAEADRAVDALLAGDLDIIADSWITRVPRDRIAKLKADPAVQVTESPGSAVMILHFNLRSGPASEKRIRRKIRQRVDRKALVRAVHHGHADPCFSLSAPTVKVWPRSRVAPVEEEALPPRKIPLRFLIKKGIAREVDLAPPLVAQLESAGFEVVVVSREEGDPYNRAVAEGLYDLRLDRTFGLPYDPYITLVYRFLPPTGPPASESSPAFGAHRDLIRLIEKATHHPDLEGRMRVYRKIQDLVDEEALAIPLYVPRRVAVVRAGLEPPVFGSDIYHLDLAPVLDAKTPLRR